MHVRFLPILPLHPVVVKSDTKLLALQAFLEQLRQQIVESEFDCDECNIWKRLVIIKACIAMVRTATRGVLYLGLT